MGAALLVEGVRGSFGAGQSSLKNGE